MSIDHSKSDFLSLSKAWFLKPSHRSLPEQIVGLGIFFAISFGLGFLQFAWMHPSNGPIWATYLTLLSLSSWSLWRRYSLRTLKLEISLFCSQFLFQLGWSVSFFVLHQTLLSLVSLLLLLCTTLLTALLFWKKERIAGQLLLLPFIWIFYLMCLNMVICISNP